MEGGIPLHALAALQGAAGQGGAAANPAIEFRAGKCKFQGTTVRPDPRKGLVRVQASSEDQLMHLTWTSRVNGVVEDDRIIFPGEASFSYVEQARNNPKNSRVYLLKFVGSSERLFFWMQDPDATKDEDVIKRVNARLNAEEEPSAGGGAGLGGMDQQQLLAMLTGAAGGEAAAAAETDGDSDMPDLVEADKRVGEAAPPAAAPSAAAPTDRPTPAPAPPAESAPAPTAAAGGAGVPEAMKGAGLLEVVEAKGVIDGLDALSDGARRALMEELPEGDRTESGLREVVRSPQLQQAVGQLDHVMQSGQGRELLMSMGIPPPEGFDNMGPGASPAPSPTASARPSTPPANRRVAEGCRAAAAVRAFLQGIQDKADRDAMKD